MPCLAGMPITPDSSLEPHRVAVAYAIYQRARQGTKLRDADNKVIPFGATIVGRLALKVQVTASQEEPEYRWLPSDEAFPSIDEIMKQNLRIVDEDTQEPGSILTTANWSLLANDA